MCAELRASVYDNGSAREVVYADIVTAVCARKLENAARTILPPLSGLPLASWKYSTGSRSSVRAAIQSRAAGP